MAETTRIKICGLTEPDVAAACSALDVWAIGLVFASPSPRHLEIPLATDVAAAIRPGVARVGVFVDPTIDELEIAVERCGLTHVQLHGASADVAAIRRTLSCAVITGHAVDGPAAIDAAQHSPADLVLLDASVRGRHGGTGQVFDWSLLEGGIGRDYLLAGGLSPDNVARAVRHLAPWAVDVSTGVERSPGHKDLDRVRSFVEAVRGATTEVSV